MNVAAALALARDAAKRDWAGAEPSSAALPTGAALLADAFPSELQALCYAACAQPRGAASGGAAALLYRNAMHRLAWQLCRGDAPRLGAASALRCAGDAALSAACEAQAEEALCGIVAQGFQDAGTSSMAVTAALRGAMHCCMRWWKHAIELLPDSCAHSAGVLPLQRVAEHVVRSMLDLQDISSDDCSVLSTALEEVTDGAAGTDLGTAAQHCTAWPRLLRLNTLLAAPLRSFVALEHRTDFSSAELHLLATAVFSDSPLREQVLEELGKG